MKKAKEADFIKLEQQPKVGNFLAWQLALRKDVASASGKPDEGFKWISEVENAKSIEELNDSGEFATLDC